jgi:hypothetical protein
VPDLDDELIDDTFAKAPQAFVGCGICLNVHCEYGIETITK